jgi:hypothetical protein
LEHIIVEKLLVWLSGALFVLNEQAVSFHDIVTACNDAVGLDWYLVLVRGVMNVSKVVC